MRHEEFTLEASDGLLLSGQVWEPEGQTRAVLCLMHGLGEHSGRYEHVAHYFSREGLILHALDLRGHGRSGGKRGHIPSFERAMDDFNLQVEDARRRYPGLPVFLYGHSLGGSFLMNIMLRRKPPVAGIISTGPLLRAAYRPPAWKMTLGKVLYHLWPSFVMANGLDQTALSRDPAVVQAYIDDPLVHDRVSARLGLDLFITGEWALGHAEDLAIPLLLIHGTADRLTSSDGSKEFANKAGFLCTLKLMEGFYHEVHNEPEKETVLALMCGWIDQVLESTLVKQRA